MKGIYLRVFSTYGQWSYLDAFWVNYGWAMGSIEDLSANDVLGHWSHVAPIVLP